MSDEKMLEMLATHDVQDVSELFSLADKYARAAEGLVWHSQPAPEAEKANKPDAGAAAQGSGKNNKKKKADGNNKPLVAAAVMAGGVVAHEATGGRSSPLALMRVVHDARYTTPSATAWRSVSKSESL
jgi:hypothetical protein